MKQRMVKYTMIDASGHKHTGNVTLDDYKSIVQNCELVKFQGMLVFVYTNECCIKYQL